MIAAAVSCMIMELVGWTPAIDGFYRTATGEAWEFSYLGGVKVTQGAHQSLYGYGIWDSPLYGQRLVLATTHGDQPKCYSIALAIVTTPGGNLMLSVGGIWLREVRRTD